MSQLIAENPDFPHEGGGKRGARMYISLPEAYAWEMERARESARPEESQGERLKREQADRVALENATKRGELCVFEDMAQVVTGAFLTLRSERNGIAGRLANELAGLPPAEIRVRILDELRRCDEQFAQRIGALGEAEGAGPEDIAGVPAAAQA